MAKKFKEFVKENWKLLVGVGISASLSGFVCYQIGYEKGYYGPINFVHLMENDIDGITFEEYCNRVGKDVNKMVKFINDTYSPIIPYTKDNTVGVILN